MSNARGGYGGRGGGRGGGGGGPAGLLLNPQVIGIFTNLFLQLPFSRRAEAEADLIGLKLMGLAGYDPQVTNSAEEDLLASFFFTSNLCFLELECQVLRST